MSSTRKAVAAGAVLPTNDEGPTFAASAPLQCNRSEKLNCRVVSRTGQDLRSEGADYARAWLDRLNLGTARPGELSTIVAVLDGGEMLAGACDVIERAVGVHHA